VDFHRGTENALGNRIVQHQKSARVFHSSVVESPEVGQHEKDQLLGALGPMKADIVESRRSRSQPPVHDFVL
jgi:hypothetical protein